MKHPLTPTLWSGAATRDSARGARTSTRGREAHPLLGWFPLAVIAFATVLVLFALVMAQHNSATDPDLSPGTGAPHVASVAGATGAASLAPE